MRLPNVALAAAVLSLTATPALASGVSNPAASLSVAKSVRAATPAKKSSKLAGDAIVPLAIAAAIVVGGIIIAVSDDDDQAKSP